MADEAIPTDATNSVVTSTDAPVATEQPSSTTASEADALDGASVLGDAQAPVKEGGDGSNDGDTGGAEAGSPDGEAEAAALIGAPEGDYELSGLPEGTVIDKAALEAIAPIAKEMNISNAGLSKLAAAYAEKVLPSAVKSVTDGFTSQVVAQRAEWDTATRLMISGGKDAAGTDIKADPTFRGMSLEQVQGVAAKALDRFGGAGAREFLKETGLGNDPRFVMFAFKAGDAISEDSDFVRPGDVPVTAKSREEKYYPTMAGS